MRKKGADSHMFFLASGYCFPLHYSAVTFSLVFIFLFKATLVKNTQKKKEIFLRPVLGKFSLTPLSVSSSLICFQLSEDDVY